MTHEASQCHHMTDIIGLLGKTDNPQQAMYAQVALRQLPCNGWTFVVNYMTCWLTLSAFGRVTVGLLL